MESNFCIAARRGPVVKQCPSWAEKIQESGIKCYCHERLEPKPEAEAAPHAAAAPVSDLAANPLYKAAPATPHEHGDLPRGGGRLHHIATEGL